METNSEKTCGLKALPQRESREGAVWYAMRVTYRREMRVKAAMDAIGVQAFVPMRRIMLRGKKQLENALEPAIHNLIFILASEEQVQALKKPRPELQYMMRQMDGRTEKIIVPERQMADFMKVCTESPDYVKMEIIGADRLMLKSGEEVIVVSGPLQGVRGQFQRVSGHRSRRLVVSIPGACAATIEIGAEEVKAVHGS